MLRADTPICDGKLSLEVEGYLDGLARAIQECETPMTIAIQGDWGVGKTTALNYLEQKLHQNAPQAPSAEDVESSNKNRRRREERRRNARRREDAAVPSRGHWLRGKQSSQPRSDGNIVIRFNTWPYSQFNLEDRLPLFLLQDVYRQLAEATGTGRKKHMSAASKRLGKILLETLPDELQFSASVAGLVKVRASKKLSNTLHGTQREDALVDTLTNLRANFEQYVNEIACCCLDGDHDDEKMHKIYIMIDDLDRLSPKRAVEVLEALAVFLNIKHCVFLLAVDFGVVKQGVRAKYEGTDFNEGKASEFFDKIIQIPYRMPVTKYDLRPYISNFILDKKYQLSVEECLGRLQSSVGNNPRKIKRVFNTFMLIKRSNADEFTDNSPEEKQGDALTKKTDLQLFTMLCKQNGYPQLYEDMRRHAVSGLDLVDYYRALCDVVAEKVRELDGNLSDADGDDEAAERENKVKETTLGDLTQLIENNNDYDTVRLELLNRFLVCLREDFEIGEEVINGEKSKDDLDYKEIDNALRRACEASAIISAREESDSLENPTGEGDSIAGTIPDIYEDGKKLAQKTDKELKRIVGDDYQIRAIYKHYANSQPWIRYVTDNEENKPLLFGGANFITVKVSRDHLRFLFGAGPFYGDSDSHEEWATSEAQKSVHSELRDRIETRLKNIIKSRITCTDPNLDKYVNGPIYINNIGEEDEIAPLLEVLLEIAKEQAHLREKYESDRR